MDPVKKIVSLDVLRGLLALIVCLAHYGNITGTEVSPALGLAARLSVLCFFALSGFVISDSLARNFQRNGRINLIDFFKQRFFRIMPPLMAVIGFMIVTEAILHYAGITPASSVHNGRNDFHLDLIKVFVSLGTMGAIGDMTGGLDGPLWSLRYEIRCYVTSALLAWLLLGTQKKQWQVASAILFLTLYWIVGLFVRNEGLFSVQAPSLFTFAAGFVAFTYKDMISLKLAALVAIGCLSAAIIVIGNNIAIVDKSILFLAAQMVSGAGFAFLVIAASKLHINFRPAVLLGNMSYSLYILHYPFMLAIFFITLKFAPQWLAGSSVVILTIVGLILTLAVSALFAWIFERPGQQRRWFEQKLLPYKK